MIGVDLFWFFFPAVGGMGAEGIFIAFILCSDCFRIGGGGMEGIGNAYCIIRVSILCFIVFLLQDEEG